MNSGTGWKPAVGDKPKLLDLFCGAGGAGYGYHLAGFEVTGVDITPQPNYPFRFIQADALDFPVDGFDAVHASPPCQKYSTLSKRFRTDRLHTYPDLIEPARQKLEVSGLPYVIENVSGAPLEAPVLLCGSQFGLTTYWPGVGKAGLQRHRNFELHGFTAPGAGKHDHDYYAIPVYGYTNTNGTVIFKGKGFHGESFRDLRRMIMGIDWMEHEELNEAIPPAYTKHIGKYLIQAFWPSKWTESRCTRS